jgi:hypothetical protein
MKLGIWGGSSTTPKIFAQIKKVLDTTISHDILLYRRNVMSVGIPVGSNVVESELSTLSQMNLRDSVQKCFQLVNEVYPEVEIEYTLSTQMLPSKQGMDINFYAPTNKDGSESGNCSGEALFFYNGVPLLLVTRAFGNNGVDSTIAKMYRRQYWYMKVREENQYFSHISFVTAKREKDLENLNAISNDFVFPHNTNEFNFGTNSYFVSDELYEEKYLFLIIMKALNKAISVYQKTY